MEDLKLLKLPLQVSPQITEKLAQCKANKVAREMAEEAEHQELWQLVHDTYPELDTEGNFSLDSTYIEAGIVMLEAREKSNHNKKGLDGLSTLLRALSKS